VNWTVTNRRGHPITSGTLKQMLSYLKFNAKDGEYRLIRDEVSITTLRHSGILYPFEQWEGFAPIDEINQPRVQS
jgi:hypothetical protein